MKVLLAFLNKEAVELSRSAVLQLVLILRDRSDELHQLSLFLSAEQVGHLVGVKQVVDILHKGFILDLAIGEQEDCWLILCSTLLEDPLQILLPLQLSIGLGDLDLEDLVFTDLSGQPCQALPS